MTAREYAVHVIRVLRDAGHQALFAGGCVRDALLGLEPADFDVATDALPRRVQELFPKTFAVGAAFGVIEVVGPKPHKVQVATFRSDGPYSDGRRPDQVTYSDARADAERRDFTLNGLFFDPLDDELIDYVGGQADLAARRLRAIGDPAARFQEDRLRLLRAVRFAARFDLAIEPTTWDAIRAMASQVITVSGERIAEELRKLLPHPRRVQGVRLLRDSGLMRVILPEATADSDLALGRLAEPSFPLALAVLLGDAAPEIIGPIGERLRLANSERDRARWLLGHRESLTDPARLPLHELKPILAHPGRDELIDLHHAAGHESAAQWCLDRLAEWPADRLDPPPLVTGADVQALGLKPGPRFKEMLDTVRRAQLDETLADRDAALALLKSLH